MFIPVYIIKGKILFIKNTKITYKDNNDINIFNYLCCNDSM